MSIISAIASRMIATDSVRVDEAEHGFAFLNKAFLELQERVEATASRHIDREVAFMRTAMGDVISLAYKDWNAFAAQWECKVSFYNHIEKSNNFTFYFKEKNGCPRNFEFRFMGLKGAIH